MQRKIMLVLLGVFLLAACGGEATVVTGTVPPTLPPATKTATLTSTNTPPPTGTLTPIQILPAAPTPTATPITYVRQGTPVPQPEAAISAENIDRLVELARWGRGAIIDVQLSPGGDYMFVLTTQELIAYETRSQEELWKYVDPVGLTGMDVQPAGVLIALGTWDGRVVLVDRLEGGVVMVRQGHTGAATALIFYPDGNKLVSGGDDFKVRVWNLDDMAIEWQVDVDEMPVTQIHFSADGLNFIIDQGELIHLFAVGNGEKIAAVRSTPDDEEIYFSPGGNFFSDGVYMWNANNGEYLYKMKHDFDRWGFSAGVFSPDDTLFALSYWGEEVVDVRRVSDGELVHRLVSPFSASLFGSGGLLAAPILRSGPIEGGAFSLAFSPDGSTLAVNFGGKTEFWDVNTGEFKYWVGESGELLYSKEGERLIAWWDDGVSQIEISKKSVIHTTSGFTAGAGRQLHFSPDGRWIFSDAVVWDIPNGRKAFDFGYEWVLAISSNGDLLYTEGVKEGEIILRRMSDFGIVKTIQLSEPGVDYYYFKDLSSTGEYLTSQVSGDNIYGLYTWNLLTHELVPELTIEETSDVYYETKFSSDGRYQIRYTSLGFVVHQTTPEIKRLGVIWDDYNLIDSASFSPNGELLAVSTKEKIIVYQVDESGIGEWLVWPKTTEPWIYELAFSPDNTLLAFLNNENQVSVLALNSGEQIAQIEVHVDYIYGLAFSLDGSYLVIATDDGTIRLWGIAP